MARLFLTNIDLNTNELQNAVIQNLSSAPMSGNKEGRIYYDVTAKALYLYTNGAWKPLASGGAAASSIELTGDVTGSANVDPTTGKLTVSTTADSSFVTKTGTQTLTNKTIKDELYFDNPSTVAHDGGIKINDSNEHFQITSYTSDLDLISSNGNIVLNSDGDIYKNSVSAPNRLATISDLTNVTLNIVGTSNQVYVNDVSGTTTISLTDSVNIATQLTLGGIFSENNGILDVRNGNNVSAFKVDTDVSADTGYHGYNTYTSATGVANINSFINLSSEGNSPTGYLFVNSSSGASGFPTLHLEANGDLALRAGANGNDGNIILYTGSTSGPGTGKVYIGWNNAGGAGANASNQVATIGDINNNKYITSVDSNNFTVTAGELLLNSQIFVDTVTSKNNGNDTLYLQGGYSNITLNGDNGNIILNPDGIVTVNGNTTFSNDVTVTGNLNVQGTLNAVNRTEINIEDNTIRLNTGFTGAPTADAGIIVERGTANDTAIIWSETNKDWTLTNDGSNYYAIARKFVSVIGDASGTSFDVVHNLGTRDVTVMVRENNAEYNVVETDVRMKDLNTVTIAFTDVPDLNAYKVIIVG
jgi:hypothetical protein